MSIAPLHINVKNINNDVSDANNKEITYISDKNNLKKHSADKKRVKSNMIPRNVQKIACSVNSTFKYFSRKPQKFASQLEAFISAMKYCIIFGQCVGAFPLIDISNPAPPTGRYPQIITLRNAFCVVMSLGHVFFTIGSFYLLIQKPVTNNSITHFAVYCEFLFTCLLFIRLANKWHCLVKQVIASELNEYVDHNIANKCKIAVVSIVGFVFLEHLLSVISKIAVVRDCYDADDLYTKFYIFVKILISISFDVELPYSLAVGIILLVYRTLSSFIWNYSHVFVICISLYLTSILEQINKKILSKEGQYMPASYWRALREDFNRVSRLIRNFDDIINGIVFLNFAINLFSVCLKIFHVISQLKLNEPQRCYNYPSRCLSSLEYSVFHLYSLSFLIGRSFLVSIIASRVHSASLIAAPSLYSVPSPSYCPEVQRFLDQLHGDTIALTGLNFFYVTRQLVLSVAGTIVTYELVLFQFNDQKH